MSKYLRDIRIKQRYLGLTYSCLYFDLNWDIISFVKNICKVENSEISKFKIAFFILIHIYACIYIKLSLYINRDINILNKDI